VQSSYLRKSNTVKSGNFWGDLWQISTGS